jgi:uncharacterized protein (DUF305 family)
VIVAALLALSSDAALRKLKAKNWKRLQRLNYALFALVIVHAFFYGALLRETSPYTILLGLSAIAVVVAQGIGVWLFRRRYSRRTAEREREETDHAAGPRATQCASRSRNQSSAGRATARRLSSTSGRKLKKLAFLLLAVVALGVASCGSGNGSERAEEESTVASGKVPFDRAFIDAMVPHHQAAIEMANEAKKAGLTDPELITIAGDIIASQQGEIDQMLEWREQWFGSKEREPEATALEVLGLSAAEAGMEHSAMDLATADDVDQAFAGMMIGHHVGAIRMASPAEEKAGHDEIRRLARDIIAAQQREIGIMEKHAMGGHG